MEDLKGKLEKEFAKNSIVMLSVSGADYRNATSSLIDFSKRFRKTCYITLMILLMSYEPKVMKICAS